MEQLNAAQTIFTLFLAIFWSTRATDWPRWKPFHWAFPQARTKRRAWLAFILLNVGPVLAAALILWLLSPLGTKVRANSFFGWLVLFFVGTGPAFCIFGLSRLWIGIIERTPNRFYYTRQELEGLGYKTGSSEFELEPSIETLKLDQSVAFAASDIRVGIYQVLIALVIAMAAYIYAA
jgi:hypothetical protein